MGLDWGDYRTIKKVNLDHRKEKDLYTNDFRKAVSYMVILCILIFPFAVLAELVASTDSKKTAAATVVTMPKKPEYEQMELPFA